jgi:hypothetical protein
MGQATLESSGSKSGAGSKSWRLPIGEGRATVRLLRPLLKSSRPGNVRGKESISAGFSTPDPLRLRLKSRRDR